MKNNKEEVITKEQLEEVSDKKQLHTYEEGIRKCIGTFKRNIYDIGRLLYLSKLQFFDERWFVAWVKDRFSHDFSYETANLYMRIYKNFETAPDVVQVLPMTYLIGFIRKFKEESRNELMKMLDGVPVEEYRIKFREEWEKMHPEKTGENIDPSEKMMQKYKEDNHVKYYEWVLKGCSGFIRWNRQITRGYAGLPKMMEDLCNAPYKPDKSLDVLKKMEDERLIDMIHKTRQILDEAEQAFHKAKEELQRQIKNEQQSKVIDLPQREIAKM
jgi:hypothetical protein